MYHINCSDLAEFLAVPPFQWGATWNLMGAAWSCMEMLRQLKDVMFFFVAWSEHIRSFHYMIWGTVITPNHPKHKI